MLRVFHSWASFASCRELKARVSKATELRSQQGTCFSPCEAACVGTHVSATVQREGVRARARVCVFVCVWSMFMHAEVSLCSACPVLQGVAKGSLLSTFWSQKELR